MATERDPLLGTVFADRYRIERRLGAGGMGCVYVATQLSMSREVALKVLNPELSDSASAVQRFVREMKASSKVEHPNTIRVYDFGESSDGRLFLAMEMLPGKTLHQVLREAGALDTARLLRIGEQIARALGAAHAEGIVHRDLKPENVMLIDRYDERDQVRVLDFGIARFAESGVDDEPALTRTGTLIGTPLYMSPEQALGKPVDHRSDLYSLGVLLYQMATGAVPFTATTPIRVLFMHAHDAPKPPSLIVKGRVPERLEALILGLLAKSPADRPQTAAEVIAAIKRVTESDTLVEADGMLRPAPRLHDATAMARAQAAHRDPGAQVPTARSVTVDPDADPLMQTAAAFSGGPVAELAAGLVDTGGATIAADQPGLSSQDTGVASRAVLDTQAATMEAPRPDVTLGTVRPPASGPAAGAAAPTSAAPASAAPDVTDTSSNNATATGVAPVADPTAISAPAKTPSGGSPIRLIAIIAIVAVLTVVAALVFVLARGAGSPDSAATTTRDPTLVAASADATQSPPAVVPVPPAAAEANRAGLRDARAAAGDPVTPEGCRVTDAGTVDSLIAAVQLLNGGRPRGKRPQDTEAVAKLAALQGDNAKAAETQATLARAKLVAGDSDPDIIGLTKAARAACPAMALAWEVEGTVHLLSMRAKVARELLAEAVTLAPGFQRARYNLGLAQLSSGDAAAALATFEEVRRREPQRPGVMTGIGQAHLGAKHYPEAVAALTEATRRAPKDAATWYVLGMAYKLKADPAEAQRAWCTAAKLGHPRAGRKCPEAAGIPVPK